MTISGSVLDAANSIIFVLTGIHLGLPSSTSSKELAWESPWTGEPSELQYTGSKRVGHNWSALAHTSYIVEKWQNEVLGRGEEYEKTTVLVTKEAVVRDKLGDWD